MLFLHQGLEDKNYIISLRFLHPPKYRKSTQVDEKKDYKHNTKCVYGSLIINLLLLNLYLSFQLYITEFLKCKIYGIDSI